MDRLQTLLFGFLCVSALSLLSEVGAKRKEDGSGRDGKVLSLFQIVRFPNDPCAGSGSKNGTCYTEAECSAKSGVSQGSCANGYGVCCVFTKGCGQTSSENCTYFESSGAPLGSCDLTICKCDTNVCQLRLDFNQFMIAGPSTASVSNTLLLNGNPVAGGGIAATSHTQCLTDSFSVTNPGGITPPTICGTNTGEHMYVDAGKPGACNDLNFILGTGNSGITRQWSIKITQYSCDFDNLAPKGCTQYFFGDTTGTIMSYNFQGGTHLADQNQQICIRQERGNCRICYTTADAADFKVSGGTASIAFLGSKCCGYGVAGISTKGYDCLVIPGALRSLTTKTMIFSRFCGRTLGLGTGAATAAAERTVCSNRQPFSVRFLSDNHEFVLESTPPLVNTGFRLTYIQSSQDCGAVIA